MHFVKKILLACIAVAVFSGCSSKANKTDQPTPTGEELAKKFIIVDGHIDVPYRLENRWEDISQKTESGDFDYPRARKGGLDAPFMSIYIPARYQQTGGAKAVADSLINLGSTFLDSASANSAERVRDQIDRKIAEKEMEPGSEEARTFRATYFEEHFAYSTVEKVADHIDHVVDLVGIDHVGLGSDYDGVGNTLPVGLKDVSTYPNLLSELLDRGYTEDEIQKICSGNIFRVWNRVEEIAQDLQKDR